MAIVVVLTARRDGLQRPGESDSRHTATYLGLTQARKKSLGTPEVRPVSPQHPANGCVVEADLPRRIGQRRASSLAEVRTLGSHAGGEAVPKF